MVLLFNVNHAVMKMTLDDVGMVAAKQLAGQPPAPPFFGGALWIMRGLLLIPALQIINAIVSLWRLRDRRQDPAASSSRAFSRWQHTLLPLIPNLLAMAAPIFLRSHGMHHFIRLFMPDVYWITLISSFFAGM